MAQAGRLILLVCLALFVEGKLLIRLQSASECPMEGYFRDVVDCTKFYFCPDPSTMDSFLSQKEKEIFWKMIAGGAHCSQGSIFDESISECQQVDLVKTIPAECAVANLIEKPITPFTSDLESSNKFD